MAYFTTVGTRAGGTETFVSGISGLVSYDSTQGLRVATISVDGQWIEIRNPDGNMGLVQRVFVGEGSGFGAVAQIEYGLVDGAPALISYGAGGQAVVAHMLQANGRIGETVAQPGGTDAITAYERIELGGKTLIFTASQDASGVICWEERANGAWVREADLDLGGETGVRDVSDILSVSAHNKTWLVALSATQDAVSLMRLDAGGAATLTHRLDSADGLPVATPTAIEAVEMGGKTYLIMAAAGTSSITVMTLEPNGRMALVDQVGDDLGTRFQSLTTLEVIETGGRVFIVAGGADDGLSLLTLLPTGRLVHLESIADSTATALTNVTGLSLSLDGGDLRIFASSEGGLQVTELRVDLGDLGQVQKTGGQTVDLNGTGGDDVLEGHGGANRLDGKAGDDILMDGKGQDSLTGGAGADIFVFEADGQYDEIRDFELGVDRIDLSGMGRAYSLDAFQFQSVGNGVRIRYEGEELRVITKNGQRLEKEDFELSDLMGLWHIDVGPVVQEDQELIGTGASDILQGGTGDDTLRGEAVRAVFDTPSGQVYRVFQATLDRAPALDGHRYWTDQLQDGSLNLTQVVTGFVDSAEFQATYGNANNAQFVTLLFNNVLGRDPGQGGLQYWMNELSSGARSREEVVLGFSESLEFRDNTLAESLPYSFAGYQAEYIDDVFRLFRATLDRNPGSSGLLDWARQLAEGTDYLDIVTGFTNSAEFTNTYGNATDAQFVTLLFNNVLGRDPNQSGLDYWTGRLGDGTDTRQEVVRGFAESREFKNGTADDLTDFLRGLGENDRLDGGAGSDVLYGGVLSDSFVFQDFEGGDHMVADLEAWDVIELQGYGYANAAAALSDFRQVGADVVFEAGDTKVTFLDTHLNDVGAEMIALL